jgi:hypothetical protein
MVTFKAWFPKLPKQLMALTIKVYGPLIAEALLPRTCCALPPALRNMGGG